MFGQPCMGLSVGAWLLITRLGTKKASGGKVTPSCDQPSLFDHSLVMGPPMRFGSLLTIVVRPLPTLLVLLQQVFPYSYRYSWPTSSLLAVLEEFSGNRHPVHCRSSVV
ncbi:hypothetical protein BJ085DRAFT_27970 [Dimargaris cristalligena]|uniref:Uncharacterized protein n=1 Tax=Dimargaris cristalligena TaxID=215637 RepID=A0A4P9ZXY8_9FUNG|nr:hypothetical protein BJ085DRAFT_27970 [Dimargaris cristalligena]|eukprot:RKP38595.1 hypothetical protein BJ085DRAFT_27970 [Dimargaris cristalligena]